MADGDYWGLLGINGDKEHVCTLAPLVLSVIQSAVNENKPYRYELTVIGAISHCKIDLQRVIESLENMINI